MWQPDLIQLWSTLTTKFNPKELFLMKQSIIVQIISIGG